MNAPNRITAWVNYDGEIDGYFLDMSQSWTIDPPTHASEYIRADIHDRHVERIEAVITAALNDLNHGQYEGAFQKMKSALERKGQGA